VHSPAPYTGHYAITGRVQLCDACTIPPALPTLRARAYTLRPHHLRCPPQLPSHRCRRPPPAFSLPSAGSTTRRRTIGLEGVVELVARLLIRLSLSLHLLVVLGKISMHKARVTSPLTASCSGCACASLGSSPLFSVRSQNARAGGRSPAVPLAGRRRGRGAEGGRRAAVRGRGARPAVLSGGARARDLLNDGRAGPVPGPGLASPASASNGAALVTVLFGLFVRGFTSAAEFEPFWMTVGNSPRFQNSLRRMSRVHVDAAVRAGQHMQRLWTWRSTYSQSSAHSSACVWKAWSYDAWRMFHQPQILRTALRKDDGPQLSEPRT
jgi:hypothetical protein